MRWAGGGVLGAGGARGSQEVEGGCRRLWVVGGERGFLACSLDMGQEINGTSNTNANSVSRAAPRPMPIIRSRTRECSASSANNRSGRSNRETPLFERDRFLRFYFLRVRNARPEEMAGPTTEGEGDGGAGGGR